MTTHEVVELMTSSRSEQEWNSNCDRVQKIFNGYPDFWFSAIIASGVAQCVSASWSVKP